MNPTSATLFTIIDADGDNTSWKVLARQRQFIPAIKEIRMVHGLGLKDAKDVVEEYNRRVINAMRKVTTVSIPTGEIVIHESADGQSVDIFITKKVIAAAPIDVLPQLIANLALEHGA